MPSYKYMCEITFLTQSAISIHVINVYLQIATFIKVSINMYLHVKKIEIGFSVLELWYIRIVFKYIKMNVLVTNSDFFLFIGRDF